MPYSPVIHSQYALATTAVQQLQEPRAGGVIGRLNSSVFFKFTLVKNMAAFKHLRLSRRLWSVLLLTANAIQLTQNDGQRRSHLSIMTTSVDVRGAIRTFPAQRLCHLATSAICAQVRAPLGPQLTVC